MSVDESNESDESDDSDVVWVESVANEPVRAGSKRRCGGSLMLAKKRVELFIGVDKQFVQVIENVLPTRRTRTKKPKADKNYRSKCLTKVLLLLNFLF